MRTRIVNAHTLEPATGERRTSAWIDLDDGRIAATGSDDLQPSTMMCASLMPQEQR